MDSDMDKQIVLPQDRHINEVHSDERKYANDVPLDKVIDSIGCELKNTLTEWSNIFRQCMKIEDDTLGQLDTMLKQAYHLEAECLKHRLEAVTKLIENK